MHPIVRANIQARQKTPADKAAQMHAAGKGKRSRKRDGTKRAGSSAYRPSSSVCHDGLWLVLLTSVSSSE